MKLIIFLNSELDVAMYKFLLFPRTSEIGLDY